MRFEVHKTAYFLVCNAKRDDDEFNKKMNFDKYLVPYDWNEEAIDVMVFLMNKIRSQNQIHLVRTALIPSNMPS